MLGVDQQNSAMLVSSISNQMMSQKGQRTRISLQSGFFQSEHFKHYQVPSSLSTTPIPRSIMKRGFLKSKKAQSESFYPSNPSPSNAPKVHAEKVATPVPAASIPVLMVTKSWTPGGKYRLSYPRSDI